MLNSLSYSLPAEIEVAFAKQITSIIAEDIVNRVWARDAGVWTNSGEEDWLRWLDIAETEIAEPEKYVPLGFKSAKYEDIVLLGMGGSSLCPEVLAKTFDKQRFHILDSTNPAEVRAIESRINLTKTLFFVSSKSGSTLEPNVFLKYFYAKLAAELGDDKAGLHFVAITDPGSKLQEIAQEYQFGSTLFGEPSIGGRFSALSVFGMAPGAAMGINVPEFLKCAIEMQEACKLPEASENPGAILGSIIGVCQQAGRDKLTIITSPEIADFAAWLEQLIAESTGKNGAAVIPIEGEEILSSGDYGSDRIFAYLRLKDTSDISLDEKVKDLEGKSPLVTIELESVKNLGQEFFRWEFATAIAGSIMKINPFDQPDVETAKIEARKLTDEFEETGSLPPESPIIEDEGIKLFSSEEYANTLRDAAGDELSIKTLLAAHLAQIKAGDYFAILAFLQRNQENSHLLAKIRSNVLHNSSCATCVGFGPRFLHSTGQAYKGGGDNGVFLQITSANATDVEIPDQRYTFGIVNSAQARGDFQVLLNRGKRALRIHLSKDTSHDLNRLCNLFSYFSS